MMNEILAFTNNASLCLNNLHRFELDDACPASRLTDSKTANAAIVWIGLAGLAIASFQLAKRLAAKKDPPMIQEFASRWKEANQFVNPLIRYVPMNGLFTEEDCQHLRTIFQSWRLHSGFCFFDLLGAQMHRNWKRAGVSKDDLRTFGEICRTLSLLVMESTENPRNYGSDIKKIRSRIETLGKRLPNTNAPELKIFQGSLRSRENDRLRRIRRPSFRGKRGSGTRGAIPK